MGTDLGNLRCAIDLCDDDVFIEQDYTSPTIVNTNGLTQSRAAVVRFGDPTNELAPLLNGSYALVSSGIADSTNHDTILNDSQMVDPNGNSVNDPFAQEDNKAYDVVEWRLRLKAPAKARGFRVYYVFFSEEYDEFIGNVFNDKFYIFLEAASTNNGERTVINFTECREPETYSDFACDGQMAEDEICEQGKKYCYIAINTALSECCWYQGCPNQTKPNTDISGTGFSCGTEDVDYIGEFSEGYKYGSSTGWLYTTWPIEPSEEFEIIFHVHDTADAILDSEVIIDKFIFIEESEEAGTGPVVV